MQKTVSPTPPNIGSHSDTASNPVRGQRLAQGSKCFQGKEAFWRRRGSNGLRGKGALLRLEHLILPRRRSQASRGHSLLSLGGCTFPQGSGPGAIQHRCTHSPQDKSRHIVGHSTVRTRHRTRHQPFPSAQPAKARAPGTAGSYMAERLANAAVRAIWAASLHPTIRPKVTCMGGHDSQAAVHAHPYRCSSAAVAKVARRAGGAGCAAAQRKPPISTRHKKR
jgi:hypothetical protein